MKRVLALVIVLIVALSMAACTSPASKNVESEVPTLTWLVPGDALSDLPTVLEKANEIAERKIGAKLNIQVIDAGAYDERMKMKMAGEDAYDLAFVGYLNKYDDAVRNGSILELNDLMDQHASQLKGLVPDYLWDAITVDGKVYAVPNEQTMAGQPGVIIQKKYVDKYNLDVSNIKCIDDLEPFLDQIKKNEPDVYPYRTNFGTTMWTGNTYEVISQMFGIRKDDPTCRVINIEGTEEYKNAINKLRDWFLKGYIRADIASVMDDNAEYNAGKYVVSSATIKPGIEATVSQSLGMEVVAVEIVKPYLSTAAAKSTMIAIGNNSKYPEKAIKLIELLHTDKEFYNLICFGIEGKHYTVGGNGKVTVDPKSGYDNGRFAWKFGNQFNALIMEGQDPDVWKKTKEQNDSAKVSYLMGFVVNTDNIKTYMSSISTVSSKYAIRNKGADDPKNYWNDYIKELKTVGADKVQEEIQKQVDDFLKQKN